MSSKTIEYVLGAAHRVGKNYFRSGSEYGNISIRDEFNDLLLGDDLGVPTGTPFLIRKARLVAGTNIPEVCECVDPVTREPDKDFPCPKCHGLGHYFEENIYYGWKFRSGVKSDNNQQASMGEVGQRSHNFYFRFNEVFGKIDAIYDVLMDTEGNVVNPIQRIAQHKPTAVDVVRLDNSRVEFIAIGTRVEDGVSMNTVREARG